MTPSISAEKMDIYRKTARRRLAERERYLRALRERAMRVARRAARLLEKIPGVEAVYLFGSLAEEDSVFDAHSDLDLAVRGLDEGKYLRVLSSLLDLDHDFDVDLVRMETAPEALARKIEKEGIRL